MTFIRSTLFPKTIVVSTYAGDVRVPHRMGPLPSRLVGFMQSLLKLSKKSYLIEKNTEGQGLSIYFVGLGAFGEIFRRHCVVRQMYSGQGFNYKKVEASLMSRLQ